MNKRIFERLIQKKANFFLYVIRKTVTTKKKNIVENIINLISFQRFNKHSKLNKTLNFDNLKIFKNNFSNKSSLKRSQNYNIDINNVKSINKFSYFFLKKQNDELNT